MYFLGAPYDTLDGCSFPGMVEIPIVFGNIISIVYMIIRIGVPIILLIAGMIDLLKAITSQKQEDIQKAQSLLFKKIIVAIVIFTFFTLVQWAIDMVDKNSTSNSAMWACVNALLNGESTHGE